jgi:hypothetical protein
VDTEKSVYFAPFLRMASDDRLGWDAVSLAGRGIAAYASAQIWMLRVGKGAADPERIVEAIEGFGSAVEQLPGLWSRFDDGTMSELELVRRVTELVQFMEAWPGDEI